MKKSILVSCGFVGTVIGAGFASGKEVCLYFSDCNLLTPLLSAFLLSLFAYLFCEIGRTFQTPEVLFGKSKALFSSFVLVANAVVFCTTVAGSEEVVYLLVGLHGGAIFTVFLFLLSSLWGEKISDKVSFLSVLAIVISVAYLLFRFDEKSSFSGKFSPLSSFLYAGMNMLTGGFFLLSRCKNFQKKDSLSTALCSFFLLSFLLLSVYFLTKNYGEKVFPMLTVANKAGAEKLGCVLLYLAMHTTCTGTGAVVCGTRPEKKLLLSSLALLVSCFGFEQLIGTLYPFIGISGCAVCLLLIFLYLKKKHTPVRVKERPLGMHLHKKA